MIPKLHYHYGEANYNAKLTESEVLEIRNLWETHKHLSCAKRKELGITIPALAEEFGVHKGTLSKIVRRIYWKHI